MRKLMETEKDRRTNKLMGTHKERELRCFETGRLKGRKCGRPMIVCERERD